MNEISFSMRSWAFILHTVSHEMLVVVRALSQTSHLTPRQRNEKRHVLAHQNIYKVKFIINIYLFNVINAVLFDSMTFFTIGCVLAGFITIMVEKSSDLCMYMMRLFGAPTSDTEKR